jgi:hypothetical protein
MEDAMAQETPNQGDKPKLNPGDVAQPGTPGAGENVCPVCHGARVVDNAPCPNCGGTGVVIDAIGGG